MIAENRRLRSVAQGDRYHSQSGYQLRTKLALRKRRQELRILPNQCGFKLSDTFVQSTAIPL